MNSNKKFRVVYISHNLADPGNDYRVKNYAKALEMQGVEVDIHSLLHFDPAPYLNADLGINALILWRVAVGAKFWWTKKIIEIIEFCRINRVPIFFDTDDLIFDPQVCNENNVDGLRFLSKSELDSYHDGVKGYLKTLLLCDAATVTTPELKRRIENLGIPCFVAENGLDEKYEQALGWPNFKKISNSVVIGYTPGSKTHQKDFLQASSALAFILKKYSSAHLYILGSLDLGEFPELNGMVGTRITIEKTIGRDRVRHFYQQIDINISPLELGNYFTASKSNIKFMEAAALGVPTVASAVEPFVISIENGRNGYLCKTDGDWIAAFETLIEDSEFRIEMGLRAREFVGNKYIISKLGEKYLDFIYGVYLSLQSNRSSISTSAIKVDTKKNTKLVISWLISGIIIGGGGHRNIFRVAYYLSKFGHEINLYFYDLDCKIWQVKSILHEYFYEIDCNIYLFDGKVSKCDVLFATYWGTVPKVIENKSNASKLIYFVQDYEPMFFPMGSDYLLSEDTYRQNLYCITSGFWCEALLRNKYNAEADGFQFPIENVYTEASDKTIARKRNKVIFFAKPDMPRRCYDLGVAALKILKENSPNIEIVFFGSQHINPQNVPFDFVNAGLLPTVADLADLYRSATVGIVFSPTNPSLVPYEMMACGLPVVDLNLEDAKMKYGGTSDIALLAPSSPRGIAEAVLKLLNDEQQLADRSLKGVEFVSGFPSEIEMVRHIEGLIYKSLKLPSPS